jgi:hypothetical protein
MSLSRFLKEGVGIRVTPRRQGCLGSLDVVVGEFRSDARASNRLNATDLYNNLSI